MTTQTSGSLMYSSLNKARLSNAHNVLFFVATCSVPELFFLLLGQRIGPDRVEFKELHEVMVGHHQVVLNPHDTVRNAQIIVTELEKQTTSVKRSYRVASIGT